MIPTKTREMRRRRTSKLPKNIENLYKDTKCRECSVYVTRMDFAKILGKFTKVKIQYESTSSTKSKQSAQLSPNTNSRLKSNENGMVLIHRNAYNPHPVKEAKNVKKVKAVETEKTPRTKSNILKENNRLKKTPMSNTPLLKDKNSNYNSKNHQIKANLKSYGIVFIDPEEDYGKKESSNKCSLLDLLPDINNSILPSKDWCIDYFPKVNEPKEDKVYDRIAAELEDLMNNEKALTKTGPNEEFPSIMDILNENNTDNTPQSNEPSIPELKSNLESDDVEAMLLGKPKDEKKSEAVLMDVDNVTSLIEDVAQLNAIQDATKIEDEKLCNSNDIKCLDNPKSPSILDESLQKGIEENLPKYEFKENNFSSTEEKNCKNSKVKSLIPKSVSVSHIVFKQTINGECHKTVTCPMNLKYSINLEGKSVEFLGAPRLISSLEDLQVLLQIVNETELNSLYVMH